jgi:hypothetical protein
LDVGFDFGEVDDDVGFHDFFGEEEVVEFFACGGVAFAFEFDDGDVEFLAQGEVAVGFGDAVGGAEGGAVSEEGFASGLLDEFGDAVEDLGAGDAFFGGACAGEEVGF